MRRKFWSPFELQQLLVLYADYSAEECAAAFGCSVFAIHNGVSKLGIKKSKDWIAKRARERSCEPYHGGRAHRFYKGQPPMNKGQHYQPSGRSTETQFRPGAKPHTWRPIGYEVVREGQLWRKVTDEHRGRDCRFNFKAVPVLVWEATNGQVPEGYVVAFRAGMTTTVAEEITVDRLEIITRAEIMARNTIQNYPPELKDAMRTLGRLRRAIRKREEVA